MLSRNHPQFYVVVCYRNGNKIFRQVPEKNEKSPADKSFRLIRRALLVENTEFESVTSCMSSKRSNLLS